jgi:hypothetical protein
LSEKLSEIINSQLPRFLYVSKSTDFINYDVEWLVEFYKAEELIGGVLPYVECCNFFKEIAERSKPKIRISALDGEFCRKAWSNDVGRNVVDVGSKKLFQTGSIYKNDNTIRIQSIYKSANNTVRLTCQKACYHDQVFSHLIVDFEPDEVGNGDSIRNLLRGEYGSKLPPLEDERLVNSAGIACILFYLDEDIWTPLLVPRPRVADNSVAVFQGGWHCSASGAAEWNDAKDKRFDRLFVDDMYREIKEELGISRDEIISLDLVSICRELTRAGKPQMFFVGFTSLGFVEIMNRIERAKKIARKKGAKTESLRFPIYRFDWEIGEFFGKVEKIASSEKDADQFIRLGLTTEAATALYYAFRALSLYRPR